MSNNVATLIGETLQTASINRNPDPRYDNNPSTAASRKSPVRFRSRPAYRRRTSSSSSTNSISPDVRPGEIPVSVLQPVPRTTTLPPLPDLRFEQSYLARIKNCTTWQSIAWTTFWDHVAMPLAQGIIWNLVVFGWRAWNSETKFAGTAVGARIRRWWWAVNGWKVPGVQKQGASVDHETAKAVERAEEFFTVQFGNAGAD